MFNNRRVNHTSQIVMYFRKDEKKNIEMKAI